MTDFRLSSSVEPGNCKICKKIQKNFIVMSCFLCEEEDERFCSDCCESQNIVKICRCGKNRKRVFVSEFYKDYKCIMFQEINAEIIFREGIDLTCCDVKKIKKIL